MENKEVLVITPNKIYYASEPNLTTEEKYKETMMLIATNINIKKVLGEQVSNEI
jgi:hypothetical protein